MTLYLTAKTNIPDLYIDYIEVRLASGEEVSLNWDESGIDRTSSGFSASYKGVYFGEEYANGKLDQLQGMEILNIGVYYETDQELNFTIRSMEFVEDGKSEIFRAEWLETLVPEKRVQWRAKTNYVQGSLTEEEMNMKEQKFTHENGYSAVLYGDSSLSVYYDGKKVLHTGSANTKTEKEVLELLATMPDFISLMDEKTDSLPTDDGKYIRWYCEDGRDHCIDSFKSFEGAKEFAMHNPEVLEIHKYHFTTLKDTDEFNVECVDPNDIEYLGCVWKRDGWNESETEEDYKVTDEMKALLKQIADLCEKASDEVYEDEVLEDTGILNMCDKLMGAIDQYLEKE